MERLSHAPRLTPHLTQLLKPYREWIPGRAVLSLGLRAGRCASRGARIAREPSGVWRPEDHPPPPAVPSLAQPPPGSGWARQPQGPEAGRTSWAFPQGRGEEEGEGGGEEGVWSPKTPSWCPRPSLSFVPPEASAGALPATSLRCTEPPGKRSDL